MAAAFAFVVLAIIAGICFVIGLAPVAIIAIVLAVVAGIWALVALAFGVTPGRAIRHTSKPELLGPGGPDDPDRGR